MQRLFVETRNSLYEITILDRWNRKGTILYSGGQGVLYLPNGNPDGSGVNICKMTQ